MKNDSNNYMSLYSLSFLTFPPTALTAKRAAALGKGASVPNTLLGIGAICLPTPCRLGPECMIRAIVATERPKVCPQRDAMARCSLPSRGKQAAGASGRTAVQRVRIAGAEAMQVQRRAVRTRGGAGQREWEREREQRERKRRRVVNCIVKMFETVGKMDAGGGVCDGVEVVGEGERRFI